MKVRWVLAFVMGLLGCIVAYGTTFFGISLLKGADVSVLVGAFYVVSASWAVTRRNERGSPLARALLTPLIWGGSLAALGYGTAAFVSDVHVNLPGSGWLVGLAAGSWAGAAALLPVLDRAPRNWRLLSGAASAALVGLFMGYVDARRQVALVGSPPPPMTADFLAMLAFCGVLLAAITESLLALLPSRRPVP
jgi:hypothetical protein